MFGRSFAYIYNQLTTQAYNKYAQAKAAIYYRPTEGRLPVSLYFTPNPPPLKAPLFTYIQKNTFIPRFIAKIPTQDPLLQQIHAAVTTGNSQADVFKEDNCYLYLLALIEGKNSALSLDYWQAITTHVYLLALIQFTS